MGRNRTQHAGQSLRFRGIAAFVMLLLFGLQLAPLVQAQTTRARDCCMAAEGKGCSMHLHRSAQAQGSGHTFAALQPQCPCPPMTPVSTGTHDALSLAASHLHLALAAERAAVVQSRSLWAGQAAAPGGTRGPPSLMFAA